MSSISMTQDECMSKLAAGSVGRIAVTSRALPAIIPVNFALSGRTIVFRTEPEGMLAKATEDSVVAFEVDDVAVDGRSGWSVLAVGVARHITDGSELVRALETRLSSAVGPGRNQFVAITIGQLTGRAVQAAPDTLVAGV